MLQLLPYFKMINLSKNFYWYEFGRYMYSCDYLVCSKNFIMIMYIYTGSVWVHYYIVNSGSKEDPKIKTFVSQLCSESYFNECRREGTFANVAKYYYTCIKQAINIIHQKILIMYYVYYCSFVWV